MKSGNVKADQEFNRTGFRDNDRKIPDTRTSGICRATADLRASPE